MARRRPGADMNVFARPAGLERAGPLRSRPLQILLLLALVLIAAYLWTAPLRTERALRRATLPELEALARRQPERPRVLFHLGRRLLESGQPQAAADAWARAAERDLHDEDIWLAAAAGGALRGEEAQFAILKTFLGENPGSARAHLALARLYHQTHAFERAYEEARAAARLDGRDSEAWRLAGAAAAATGWTDKAEAAMRRAVEAAPRDWRNPAALGDVLTEQERFADAVPWYRKAVQLAPAEPVPHLSLGRALLKSATTPAEIATARSSLLRSRDLRDDIPMTHLLLGQSYARSGLWPEARTSLERAQTLDPDQADVPLALSRVYARLGDRKAAQKAAARHRQITDNNAFSDRKRALLEAIAQAAGHGSGDNAATVARRLELARLLATHDETVEAGRQYRMLLAQAPDPNTARVARRELAALPALPALPTLTDSAPTADAAGAFLRVLKRDPHNADALEGAGLALSGRGEPEKAVPFLLEATRLDPARTRAQFELGVRYQSAGFLKEAIRRFRAVAEQEPENAVAWHRLGEALRDAGRPSAEAENAFSRAVALDGSDTALLLDLAETQAAAQKPDAARSTFRRALALAPKNNDVLARFGGFLAGEATPESRSEAERLLTAALAADPGDDYARFQLGRVALDRGDAGRAVALLEKVVAQPDNQNAADVWYTLSRAYRRLGKRVQADRAARISGRLQEDFIAFTQAREKVDLHPEDPKLRLDLARRNARRGENALAINAYQQCLRLDPKNAAARKELAALETRLKKIGKMPQMDLFRAMVAAAETPAVPEAP